MLIPIPYGKRFSFVAVAERCCEIRCPQCGVSFRMFDRVGAVGEGFSLLGLQDGKAADLARQEALKRLENEAQCLSPVPCPGCGAFHPAMNAIRRWLFWQRVLFGAMACVAASATAALLLFLRMDLQEKLVLLAAGAGALGFLAYRYWKDLRLCPVRLERSEGQADTPALRVGLRFHDAQDWLWLVPKC